MPVERVALAAVDSLFVTLTAVVSTRNPDASPNHAAIAWVAPVSRKPNLISISVNRGHQTNENIKRSGLFCANVLSCAHMKAVNDCGRVSKKRSAACEKAGLFAEVPTDVPDAPVIARAQAALQCRVVHAYDAPSNTVFIAEVIGTFAQPEVVKRTAFDIQKVDPLLFSFSGPSYLRAGARIGVPWAADPEAALK